MLFRRTFPQSAQRASIASKKAPSVSKKVSTTDFQSEVGKVFGEIGGELSAKCGRRFSNLSCWGKSSEAFPPTLHRKFHHQTSLTRFWVVAGPKNRSPEQLQKNLNCKQEASNCWHLPLRLPSKSFQVPLGTLGLHFIICSQGIISRNYFILFYIKQLWPNYFS